MSFNYWPKIRLFCFVFACWNIAGVFSLKKLVIGDKIRTRREVAQNELLEEFKSRAALTALSSQSWDENGNIVINGRLDVSSSFSIISQIKTEAELGIVICRQDANSKCDKPGLVLCYKANGPFDEKQINRNDEHFNHLKKVCRKENGFVVTTETTETENFFRIDTRFGNTYRVIIPAKNCIVLWLTYDIFGVDDRKVFETNQNYRVYALNSATEIANLNTTKIGTKYAQDWSYVSEYENETLINMLWKEVHVEPRLDEIYSNISFSASGGDYCCALTAKIIGHEVVKCYMKWEDMGTLCEAPGHLGHKTECQVSSVLGYDDYTKKWLSNDTSTGMSQSQKQAFQEMVGQMESNEMTSETFKETMKETIDKLSEKYNTTLKESDKSNITGHIDGKMKAELKVIQGELNAEGNVELIKQNHKDQQNLTIKEFVNSGMEKFKEMKKKFSYASLKKKQQSMLNQLLQVQKIKIFLKDISVSQDARWKMKFALLLTLSPIQ
uniref:Uncharacterized protein n=1 Tax=Ditylenchus dipsaci TaxID=166011 RepID=A0A915E389_9BILA